MKRILPVLICLLCFLTACGETPPSESPPSKHAAIPFAEDHAYAVAWVGYQQPEDLTPYTDQYLDSDELPIHYVSDGDFYLVIPRYPDMDLHLYVNDLEAMGTTLRYEEANCRPFIVQCNVSDIFPDITILLTRGEENVEFSPFLSLMDGSLDIGPQGLDLTIP